MKVKECRVKRVESVSDKSIIKRFLAPFLDYKGLQQLFSHAEINLPLFNINYP